MFIYNMLGRVGGIFFPVGGSRILPKGSHKLRVAESDRIGAMFSLNSCLSSLNRVKGVDPSVQVTDTLLMRVHILHVTQCSSVEHRIHLAAFPLFPPLHISPMFGRLKSLLTLLAVSNSIPSCRNQLLHITVERRGRNSSVERLDTLLQLPRPLRE